MSKTRMLNFSDYSTIVFDWDGTLVSSHNAYREMDRIFVKEQYSADISSSFLWELMSWSKLKQPDAAMETYYHSIDVIFGKGDLTFEQIYHNLEGVNRRYVLPNIEYKAGSHTVLHSIKSLPGKKVALVTGARTYEIDFFSSENSETAHHLAPNEFFDLIVTRDDVVNAKPHPESYDKVVSHFDLKDSSKVLVFEDSLVGARAARAAGMDVAIIHDSHSDHEREQINLLASYVFTDWSEVEAALGCAA